MPCAGQTGVMLETALPLLFARMPTVFQSVERHRYLITNAWPQVEHKARTGRSVPRKSEISSRENVERLYHEVKSLRYLVACGRLAHISIELCQQIFHLEATVAKVSHTSRQALGCPTNAGLHARLDEWARSVTEKFAEQTGVLEPSQKSDAAQRFIVASADRDHVNAQKVTQELRNRGHSVKHTRTPPNN